MSFISRLNRYLYCDEGSSAFIPAYDTADTRSDLSQVVDIDELRDQLNNSKVAVFCVPRPQPRKY
jgi:thiamine biosynthesis protein ThiC